MSMEITKSIVVIDALKCPLCGRHFRMLDGEDWTLDADGAFAISRCGTKTRGTITIKGTIFTTHPEHRP